jgi:hypothetical protein
MEKEVTKVHRRRVTLHKVYWRRAIILRQWLQ